MQGNLITLVGNLTRDPEFRYTQNGIALTKMGLAWNLRNQRDGTESVSFFNITCWGELAENISNSNLAKGSRVVVVGRLDQDSYETREGEKRSSVQIIAEEVSPSLRWATVNVNRVESGAQRQNGNSQERSATEQDDNQTVSVGAEEEPF